MTSRATAADRVGRRTVQAPGGDPGTDRRCHKIIRPVNLPIARRCACTGAVPVTRRRPPADPARRTTVSRLTDADLYLRGTETLLASWEEYARRATAATVHRVPGVAAGVFPEEPERAVYNNALLDRHLGA